MIIPKKHLPKLENFTRKERCEFMEILNFAQQRLLRALNLNSCNIGINIGPYSGGSIPDHLHIHIVPRWNNDNNFMHLLTDFHPYRGSDLTTIKHIRNIFSKN